MSKGNAGLEGVLRRTHKRGRGRGEEEDKEEKEGKRWRVKEREKRREEQADWGERPSSNIKQSAPKENCRRGEHN